jgi:hypothetical protein
VAEAISSGSGSELDRLFQRANRQLGEAGRRVVRFIDENRQTVLASSAAALGSYVGTSDATVVRTIQALGFAGLGDLKRAILKSTDKVSTPADHMRRTLADLEKTTGQAFDSVLLAHSDGLAVLNSERCRTQIAAAVGLLDVSERIAVFGIGPSAALASYVSISLARSGRPSRTISATGSMLADQLLRRWSSYPRLRPSLQGGQDRLYRSEGPGARDRAGDGSREHAAGEVGRCRRRDPARAAGTSLLAWCHAGRP